MGASDGLEDVIRDAEQLDLRGTDTLAREHWRGSRTFQKVYSLVRPLMAKRVSERIEPPPTRTGAYKALEPLYRPLKEDVHEIRLLVVQPGENYETLHCQLVYMSMAEAVRHGYEAVSYCWGDKNDTSIIEISDLKLTASTSAKQAILRFRNQTEPRHLWIDSVCLNQQDDLEKTYQVARMHHVYKNSSKTLIWLGEDDGTVGKAMRIMEDLLEEIRNKTLDEEGFNDLVSNGFMPSTTVTISFDSEPLVSLFARPWIRRLWVVQEITISSTNACHCGQHSIELRSIITVARWLYFKRRFLPNKVRFDRQLIIISELRHFTDSKAGQFPTAATEDNLSFIWLDLLCRLRSWECHDPKDHVFGLLGMYQRFSRQSRLPALLTPLYSKSLAEIMRDATRHTIDSSRSLGCLMYVNHGVETKETGLHIWPSWVPRWHVRHDSDLDARAFDSLFGADRLYGASTTDKKSWDILEVQGIVVEGWKASKVYAVTTICVSAQDVEMESFIREVFKLWEAHGTSEEIQGLAMTLAGGTDENWQKITGVKNLDDFLCFRRYWDKKEAIPPSPRDATDPHASRAYWYYYTMRYWANRRRFIITAGGRPGLGPQTMQEGDIVTILFGCSYPCVLRRRENKEYEFIGCCYVAGIMEGEAVEKHDEEGKQYERFAIR